MTIDNAIVEALLANYNIQPTGYRERDTITYGALAPEYLYQKLGRPDASDSNQTKGVKPDQRGQHRSFWSRHATSPPY